MLAGLAYLSMALDDWTGLLQIIPISMDTERIST
jgi:hypothetical protein